jgi:hypothetical protein
MSVFGVKKRVYTEGSFGVGFMMSDFGMCLQFFFIPICHAFFLNRKNNANARYRFVEMP